MKAIENVMIILSSLWIVRMLSQFLGDTLRAQDPIFLNELIAGETAVQITREFLLIFAIIFVIPIVMVFLSLTLGYKANRRANISLGIFFAGFDLVFLILLLLGILPGAPAYDIFLAFVYPVFPALIVWYAWKWKQEG